MKFQDSAKYLTDLIIYLYMDRWFFFHRKSTWCTRTSMRFGLYFEKCCFATKIEIHLLNMGAFPWHLLHLYQNSYNWICMFTKRLHDISENFLHEHYTTLIIIGHVQSFVYLSTLKLIFKTLIFSFSLLSQEALPMTFSSLYPPPEILNTFSYRNSKFVTLMSFY